MSNLSRKVKKATEPVSKARDRRERRHERRVRARIGAPMFKSPGDLKVEAFNSLSVEEQQRAEQHYEGLGVPVVNLDSVAYKTSIRWEPQVGWYPVCEVFYDA